ncbi:hypothetical protein [Yinghuangia sp. YIM S09857]|uniref:hypothetical protein n=1 Tax=Yinghuangia sp. YIM S09857 TaxID=3436929 RepID=UPI003F52AB1B
MKFSRSEIKIREAVDLAGKALAPYDPDNATAVSDLLANLMHYCREKGIDWDEVKHRADTTVLLDMMGV